jgi:pimeloyl-ACP methyl ester carboxylesterase
MKKIFTIALLIVICFATFGQEAPKEKFVTVFGAKIRYLEAGEKNQNVVILLHGLGSSAESWQFNISTLSQRFRIIAPDQVGFGKSDKPFLKYRVSTYVDFLDKFMSELKIEKASIVGNSLGGWIAALTAIKYPNRVEKLVLVDSAGILPPDLNKQDIYLLNGSTRDEIKKVLELIFANPLFHSVADQILTQRVTANDGYTIQSLIESILRKEDFLNGQLGQIKKPTLIIWGKKDGLLPVSDAYKFNNEIAGSKLHIFEDCGHVPQIEKAAEFNQLVEEFLIAR